ncbi:MAG: hypothetical protein V1664_04005 [Candidatus Uhrbacteria bacterium]
MTDQKRFVLIEILIVVAVIGLIGTLSAVAVASARANTRDATRLAQVRQMQSALEDFFVQNNTYPVSDNVLALGFGEAACLDTEGFHAACEAGASGVLAKAIPVALGTGLDGLATCGGAANAFCYSAANQGAAYGIIFELENAIPLAKLQKGLNCATPEGMKPEACSFANE